MMKVSELIEELKKEPQEMDVHVWSANHDNATSDIYISKIEDGDY